MPIMKQLLSLLQAEIDANVVTVVSLSNKLGCSRQHIYNILNGKRKPTLDFAERLATELGLSINLAVRKKTKKMQI